MATTSAERLQRLRDLVEEKALIWGKFTLSSGLESPWYLDLKKVLLLPEGAYLIGQATLELLQEEAYTAVGGYGLGGQLMTSAVVTVSWPSARPIRGFYILEQDCGLVIKGHFPPGGIAVALVDDVLTSGKSLARAIKAVQANGCRVGQIVVVIDRGQGGLARLQGQGYEVRALLSADASGKISING